MPTNQTRRSLLGTAASAGFACMLPSLRARAGDSKPETTTLRLPKSPAICTIPQMITEQLLRSEGFTEIRYVDMPPPGTELLAGGDVDFMVNYASNFIIGLDKGDASTLLAGVHVGCFVLFGNENVHGIASLKGKTVGVPGFGTAADLLLTLMAAEVRQYPMATKRAMRAILKAADLCAAEPPRAARMLVDGGFTSSYDYALQTLKDVQYDRWREYDAEDAVRFWALRLREAKFIKSSPQKIIADGTDWRFLNELKRELKA